MDSSIYSYDEAVRPIDHIDFSILGNTEIENISALGKDTIGIDIPDLYDNMEPKRGGLIDTRMGTTDSNIDCSTCGLNSTYCVGHFGHIRLAEPIFHFGYIPFLKKILSCVCLKCSKLLVYKNENELIEMLKNKSAKARFAEIRNIAKSVNYCQKPGYGCGTPVSKIKIDIKKSSLSINIIAETSLENLPDEQDEDKKKKIIQILTPEMCYDILKNISDIDCMIMGLDPKKSRPEMMIHKIFPVPPVAVRPSARVDFLGSGVMDDDLTKKLAEIIKANIRIRKDKEASTGQSSKYSQDNLHFLQYHEATYFDNDALPQQSESRGKPIRSLSSRIKGKEGRIRGSLEGKRVDFSARTVITPDPSLDINQLGVPIKIAMTLTFPEVVTPQNINKLSELVRNGRDKYPGANFVFPISNIELGRRALPIDLRYRKEKVELRFGDIVERHIVDGDFVLLNRQPTLHKLSMMGHKIKVIVNDDLATFRLNTAVTTPYNADFDGDEMNIFVPQSIQTQIELEDIADVKRQIISPATSKTIIGVVQDGILGAYNLTASSIKINWKDTMNMLSYTTIEDLNKVKKNKEYEGKEVYSQIIPDKISTINKGLEIVNGELKKGQIKKDQLGAKQKNSLVHLIWDEYGMDETKQFLDNTQKLVNNYNLYNGFTVGVGDIAVSKETYDQMNKLFEKKKLEVDHLITEMEKNPDVLDPTTFENTIYLGLNTVRDDISKLIMSNLDPLNNFNIMISSGSKGSDVNMGQMGGCIGQQAVEGKRIQKKIHKRSLAHFYQNDDSAIARGFIQQPYLTGADPIGFYFHNMSSREGLIDTAIKTAESGYIQRKLIKSMEDLMIKYDSTVRNANNTIFQFVYGDNGLDTTRQFDHTLKTLEMGNKEIINRYKFTKEELRNYSNFSDKKNNEFVENLIKLRNDIRDSKLKSILNFRTFDSTYMLGANFTRIIDNVKNSSMNSKEELEPNYILEKLESVLDYDNIKILALRESEYKNKNSLKYKDEQICKTALKLALYEYLAPKISIIELKLNKVKFDYIIESIINSYNKSVVEPGEMVGIIAAQSIGEPVTQLTLNTFHHSGIGSMGATTLGVPRMKELMSVSRNMKTPVMIIYLEKEFKNNGVVANRIQSYIKHTTFKDVRNRIDIYYDPEPLDKDSFMENDKVYNIFYSHNPTKLSCQADITKLPWLVRIEMNKEKMMEKNITLLDIKSKFCSKWEKRYKDNKGIKKEERQLLEKISQTAILSNNDNDKSPIIHIRFDLTDFDFNTLIRFIDTFVDDFKLKGIDKIENINNVSEERIISFDNEDQELKNDTQYIIYTAGINLRDIRYINGIDINRTYCNDISEIYEKFGIEAARSVLMRETKNVFEGAGNKVNFQNTSNLIDLMTNNGTITSIDRHGLNRIDTDPLSRASFEKTVDVLLQAAVFGETDYMKSVSSRIMAGLVIKGGTGLFDIKLDTDLLQNSEYIEELQTKYKKTFNELTSNSVVDDVIKHTQDGLFIPL